MCRPPGFDSCWVANRGLTATASAPVKAIGLLGASPDQGSRHLPEIDGNCVFMRKGGKQPKMKE